MLLRGVLGRGVRQVAIYADGVGSVAVLPLVVRVDVLVSRPKMTPAYAIARRHYFWLFGYVIKLPCEHERTVVTLPLKKTPVRLSEMLDSLNQP